MINEDHYVSTCYLKTISKRCSYS